jgi:hypothetical protein
MQNISSNEDNLGYYLRKYIYNNSESTNLFSYNLGGVGTTFTHMTSVVSTLIGGVEDLVVNSIKDITGINHFLFSGALYTGINSVICTWLIQNIEEYSYDYKILRTDAVII